jgi:hypothetical protein
MKGDFSRSTFRRNKHYDGVRLQQGRVLLDAEVNELVDVQNYLRTTTARDVIGPAGAPRYNDGFAVHWADANLAFTGGRFYVDGILCESEGETIRVTAPGTPAADVILDQWSADATLLANGRFIEVIGRDAANLRKTAILKINLADAATRKLTMGNVFAGFAKLDAIRTTNTYLTQPDYPNPAQTEIVASKTQVKAAAYLVWLDVWQRHITHLEDPLIREIALGGPDTTTRTKTLWQVRLEPNVTDCKTFVPPSSTGRMAARDNKPAGPPQQCEISPQAGYRRLENQLYRVEIHTPGTRATARFKWSRENGSVVFAIESAVPGHLDQLKLRAIGRDDVLRLQQNDVVELIDDVKELDGTPGALLTVTTPPAESDRIVTLSANATNVDLTKNPRLRLWQSGETQLGGGAFVALEDGVEVRFEAGNYRTGDSWTIPARTAISDETGHIEWPADGVGNALALPAEAIVHHFAPLATIDATGKVTHDCRSLFAPITAPDLFYLAGDGQEVSLANPKLPQNLEVLVSNGAPVAGAKVEFRVTNGAGNVSTVADTNPGTTLIVTTGVDGKAACIWRTDLTAIRQTVTARLIELEAKDYVPELPPIAFNAWIKYAKNVVYEPGACTFLNGTSTVQEALDKLCNRPSGGGICTLVLTPDMDWPKAILDLPQNRDAEICFGVGVFELAETLRLGGRRRLTLTGTGKGSRIVGKGIGELVVFEGNTDVVVRDLSFESEVVPPPQATITDLALPGVVAVLKSTDALFEDVRISCGDRAEKGIACLIFNTMTTEARVSRCEFDVGSEQVGIVAQRTNTVQIESCRFTGPARARIEDLPLRALPELLPELAFAPTERHNVTLNFETERIAFRVSEAEAKEWNRFPPLRIVPAGTSPEAVQPTLLRFIARLPAGDFPFAARRIEPIVARFTAANAAEAIVVVRAGTAVSIADNVIAKFARGMLLGAHYVNDQRVIDANLRVFVVDNTVLLTVRTDRDSKTEHGIDIGSCRHLTVRGNHVEADRRNAGQVFGMNIEGDFGVFAIARDNQVTHFTFGFNAVGAPDPGSEKRKWLLADNVADDVNEKVTAATNFNHSTTMKV